MRDSLIPSFLMSDVNESLRSLTKNERCERIAQALTKNERMSESLVFLGELLIRLLFRKKRAIHSENLWANSQPWSGVSNSTCWYWYSVVDPDPYCIRIQELPGSVIGIRIRIYTCKYRLKWRQKMQDLRY